MWALVGSLEIADSENETSRFLEMPGALLCETSQVDSPLDFRCADVRYVGLRVLGVAILEHWC